MDQASRDHCLDDHEVEGMLSGLIAKVGRLHALSERMAEADSVDALLEELAGSVADILPADRVSVILFDPVRRCVESFVRGGPGAHLIDTNVAYGELESGLSGWVLAENRPALSAKDCTDPRESSEARARRIRTACGCIIVVPLRQGGATLGTMTAINRPDQRDFTPGDLELLALVGNYCASLVTNARLISRLEAANAELAALSARDPLTGLANRRAIDDRAEPTWRDCRRRQVPHALILLDIDWYKQYNDCFGHQAGDECLKAVAEVLAAACRRPADLALRYGGDEFLLALPDTSPAAARALAEGLRTAMATRAIAQAPTAGRPLVTLSIGVAAGLPRPDETLSDRLRLADAALYQSKRDGRDRATLLEAEGTAPTPPCPPTDSPARG